ncbi:MAG TPA: helix-turn-helix transcriptional regulator, partial [Candidatus Limnocylindrales bacterium]|nr:helix-turn-helix transcriptional regulator [Candidatus Limnocylindrales bacterium]
RFSIEWPLWARALVHEAAGDLAAALADARQACEAIDATGTTYRHRVLGIDLTRMAAAAGDVDFARAVAERVAALATGAIASTRAAAELARGLATADLESLLGAAELYRRTGRAAELATALEAAGTLRAKRDDRGRDELVAALAIYEQMEAHRRAARVRAVLRDRGWRLGAGAKRRRPTTGWESLTEAERAVAGLLAEGLTNRQIAARRFVSPRTAESHVAHLRAKLGGETRFAIAEQVRQALEAGESGRRGEGDGPP